jgi:hypothetical protein
VIEVRVILLATVIKAVIATLLIHTASVPLVRLVDDGSNHFGIGCALRHHGLRVAQLLQFGSFESASHFLGFYLLLVVRPLLMEPIKDEAPYCLLVGNAVGKHRVLVPQYKFIVFRESDVKAS